ncbi:hypothetical protein GWK47_003757 [Chionoecetes opilio]|uniref:Uncharacterized protein n=1 Tax=Chionoecetes opilio TaxID=41210 RepID=A0A8J5D3P6_CHIOP|nr:hypothetical protein GWK47_003757 [Chionoecetes opilio]
MFAEQLEYDEEKVVKLEKASTLPRTVLYTPVDVIYIGADAPANDLQFMKDMMKFKRTDPEIAQAVLQKLETTNWYLTQEVVPFALFGTDSVTKRKQDIAASCTPLRSQNSFQTRETYVPSGYSQDDSG